MNPAAARSPLARLERLAWLVIAVPGLLHLGLLGYAMAARAAYPYDLEWMEGGLLAHAQRIAERQGIYVEPSIVFIPYLYTPLYPAVLALVGSLFGISYTTGRVLSILAVLGTVAVIATAIVRDGGAERRIKWAGASLAVGFYAATYPWVEGWYDLVRADSLFVLIALGGLLGLRVWARLPGPGGLRRVAVAAALLALSFFCKQTGVLYVATGGALLLVLNWRRLPIYALVAGVVGLGGTWLFNRASAGWFWTYAFKVHQVHDFSHDRFVASFGHMLWHFPTMTIAIGLGLGATAIAGWRRRARPAASAALLYWTPVFAVSLLVGALGWGTQWAHYNAYVPAMATGAIAAGAALPALYGALRDLGLRAPATLASLALGGAMATQLGLGLWNPGRFIPSDDDRAAGDALIEHLRGIEGDVFIPYHPWYAALAGKPLYTHRMGLLDMSYKNHWPITGLREAIASQRFGAIVLDRAPAEQERAPGPEFPGLTAAYRLDDVLPAEEQPHVYTGAPILPATIWVPRRPVPLPADAEVLYDFERGKLEGWSEHGKAWLGPVASKLPGQTSVYRYGGRYYLSSCHGGNAAKGMLTSPPIVLDGSRITLLLSGGNDPEKLRAMLVVDGQPVKIATGKNSERMEEVVWDVSALAGKTARIVLDDEAEGPFGHLNVDEIWLRR